MFSTSRLILLIAVFCQLCVTVYSAPKKYHEWRPLGPKEDYYEELINKVDTDFGTPKRTARHLKHVFPINHVKSEHHRVRSHRHKHHVYI
uniref:Uncharacterized protein n=1 Tax=Panagrolaimus davidi TaxID=227884 RepID=A0A914QUT6_9BILA